MPKAHVVSVDLGIDKCRGFPTPKGITFPYGWLREIRKVIPEIPKTRGTGWEIRNFEPSADAKSILILMTNNYGQKINIAVDRMHDHMRM